MKPDFFNCFSGYEVRRLTEDDLNEMYALCTGNPLYYEHFGSPLTLEGLRSDLTALPPGTAPEQKYFVGLRRSDKLIALLDLIHDYPPPAQPISAGSFCLPTPRDAVSARSLSNSYAIRWPPTECKRSGWPMCWAIRRASDSGRKMGSDPPAKRKIWAVIGLYAWSSHCNF